MNNRKMSVITIISLALLMIFSFSNMAVAQETIEEITIVGVVSDQREIITSDGLIYFIDETEIGDELFLNYIGLEVSVTGEASESEGDFFITVSHFEEHTE
ncbi:MAG: hypothetical protein K9L30_03525 [Desulfobacterales bacterium]|nr:hypothetical protein [Desulfobacterales bacterium]